MDFPHLRRDTEYPYLSNVDVYEFQNNFDYTRWSENTRVRLVNVIWSSDYKDVVAFENNQVRDIYFDSLDDSFNLTLEQAARIIPEGYVKLPIPYDVLARYNYLYIDMPIATSADKPLDWETTDGIRRWYFFIENVIYRAPNTTEVLLTLDVWTNFHNDVEINYLMLERGHAPMTMVDVDEYLENPIDNCEWLLAPDINFGRSTIVRNADYVPFGSGEKYVVMISTIGSTQIPNIGSVSTSASTAWTAPTYSNTSDRYGYQLVVNGYSFGDDGDFSSLNTPVQNGNSDILPNNVTAYAIKASDCFGANSTFLSDLQSKNPNFMQSLLAFFVVPIDMIELGATVSLAGHTVYKVKGKANVTQEYELDSSMFGFDSKYADFAKLYTFPYSVLEVTDNDGKSIEVHIEDTGTLQYTLMSSIAFPFLNMRVMLTGINGVGASNYSWKRIDGTTVQKLMPNSDWSDFSFDWSIPTYSLFMDGRTAYNLTSYNSMQNARRDALVGYHNTVRSANTSMQNSIDANNTAESNVNASASTLVANMANTINAQTANTNAAIAAAKSNAESANEAGWEIVAANGVQLVADNVSTNSMCVSTAREEAEVSVSCAATSGGGMINAGAISGAVGSLGIASSAGAAAAAAGMAATGVGVVGLGIIGGVAALGAMSAATSASANISNAMAMAQVKGDVAAATAGRNTAVASHADTANNRNQDAINTDRSNQTRNNNSCMRKQTRNTTDAERVNTNNDATTMNDNAARTRATGNANSGYTRTVSILNAKEILENAQDKAHARYNDSRNIRPIAVTQASGSAGSDYFETRGLQFKVRTQDASAIAQTGDYFARYGYAVNRMWNVANSGLCLMKHFTYWKASEIWVDDRKSSNNKVNRAIEKIFLDGVTVWDNPNEIGRIDIYAN